VRRLTVLLSVCLLLGIAAPASGRPAPASGASAGSGVVGRNVAATASMRAPAGARRFDGTLDAGVRQVIVVSAQSWHSTRGTLSLWTRSASGWRRIAAWPAILGYGGLVIGTKRRQDTGTTPAGSYAITSSFGRLSDPGTALPYTRVSSDHWWVEDRRSACYNQLRRGSRGGFALRTNGYNSSEHLAAMGQQYDYVAVIDFNRPHPVVGRGAGIFLHSYGSGATAGCVAIRLDRMREVLRWLTPSAHPRILIGTKAWLSG
jgi:L,D-peptidoglycan transpeptidase YkuD (ErfK/YbiS/YcfS/YnhG family)